jgi:hypothetical protein
MLVIAFLLLNKAANRSQSRHTSKDISKESALELSRIDHVPKDSVPLGYEHGSHEAIARGIGTRDLIEPSLHRPIVAPFCKPDPARNSTDRVETPDLHLSTLTASQRAVTSRDSESSKRRNEPSARRSCGRSLRIRTHWGSRRIPSQFKLP